MHALLFFLDMDTSFTFLFKLKINYVDYPSQTSEKVLIEI